jgi:transcription elongation GreA/GreB family factor
MSRLKEQLWEACRNVVDGRLATAQLAMHAAQQSANQEEKSSAGDKYETGRAMAQLEREKAALQVEENKKMLGVLSQIKSSILTEQVTLGSIVATDCNKFYVSVGAGKIVVDEEIYVAISAQSPIGQLLLSKRKGDSILFNNKKQMIISIS